MVDIITSLVNINTSYQGLVSSLDVLKRMFVEPKPGGPCAAGQIVGKELMCLCLDGSVVNKSADGDDDDGTHKAEFI